MEVENQGTQTPEPVLTDGHNVDQIMADIEAGKDPNAAAPAEGEQQEQQAPTWNGEEWAFEVGGKRIIPDSREKMKLWLGGGYNYAQRLGELNKTHAQKMAEIEAKERAAREVEERYRPYADVDKYATENKEWWEHVQQAWKTREMPQGLDPKLAAVLNPLQEKIGTLESLLTQQQQAVQAEQLAAQEQQENEALAQEIESVRKQHPDIDLSERDESGETLEIRVLKHAQEIGTRSFRAAYRDLLHDKLLVQKQAASKLQAVRGTQAEAKAGVLGKSPTPTKALKPVDPRVPWSDESLSARAVLEEFRQINGG
jgi:hypothetical protein